jgi:hypothetical protein
MGPETKAKPRHTREGGEGQGASRVPTQTACPLRQQFKHLLLVLDARLRGHDGGMVLIICFVFFSLGHL